MGGIREETYWADLGMDMELVMDKDMGTLEPVATDPVGFIDYDNRICEVVRHRYFVLLMKSYRRYI